MGGTDADGNFIQMQHMGHVPKSSRQAALLATLGGFLLSHFRRGHDPADNLLRACYSLRSKWRVVSWSCLLSTGAQSKGTDLSADTIPACQGCVGKHVARIEQLLRVSCRGGH